MGVLPPCMNCNMYMLGTSGGENKAFNLFI